MTTKTKSKSVDAEHTSSELFDGDGHVQENLLGIIEKLPEPYRELRRKELEYATDWGIMRLFPSLGFLNSAPFVMTANLGRSPEEHWLDPDSWEYFLREVGIDRTVLYPTVALTIGFVRDFDYAIALCRAYNDWMAETYLNHPSGKFQAAALLPMQDPGAAAEELKRAVTELGFCSGTMAARGLPNHFGREQFFPVYEAAQSLDVGIGIHAGNYDGLGFDDFDVYAAANALGHPSSQLIALGGMVFSGVFDRFPKLRIAYLEGGVAWTLMATERFSESFSALKPAGSKRALELPSGTSIRQYITDLMHEGRIVIGVEGGEDHLATAINYFGCTPFMYSSDFPTRGGCGIVQTRARRARRAGHRRRRQAPVASRYGPQVLPIVGFPALAIAQGPVSVSAG